MLLAQGYGSFAARRANTTLIEYTLLVRHYSKPLTCIILFSLKQFCELTTIIILVLHCEKNQSQIICQMREPIK